MVCTENPVLVRASCFFSVDETYFPLRPEGQRRLLCDGMCGSEGETASIFSSSSTHDPAVYMAEDEEHDSPGDSPGEENDSPGDEEKDDGVVAAPNGAPQTNDGRATPEAKDDSEPTERIIAQPDTTELHPYKWLKRGARILFYFDQGKFSGTYHRTKGRA